MQVESNVLNFVVRMVSQQPRQNYFLTCKLMRSFFFQFRLRRPKMAIQFVISLIFNRDLGNFAN